MHFYYRTAQAVLDVIPTLSLPPPPHVCIFCTSSLYSQCTAACHCHCPPPHVCICCTSSLYSQCTAACMMLLEQPRHTRMTPSPLPPPCPASLQMRHVCAAAPVRVHALCTWIAQHMCSRSFGGVFLTVNKPSHISYVSTAVHNPPPPTHTHTHTLILPSRTLHPGCPS
jgi:hypothetical protein